MWSGEKTSLQFMGYKRRASRHMGMGKGMVLWVREGMTVHMAKVHDDRWILAVIVTMTSHTVLVVTVHMCQRNDPGTYAQCVCTLRVLRAMYACMECIICGGWNRFLPRHAAALMWMQEASMWGHNTDKEQDSYKGWIISSKGVAATKVWYRDGVPNHPIVHFQMYVGRTWDGDKAPVGNRSTGVGSWGQREKNVWGGDHGLHERGGPEYHARVAVYRRWWQL